jgi:uncharacterized protein
MRRESRFDRVSHHRDGRANGTGPESAARRPVEAGLRFEAMATGPALRVYNVMQSEGRRVAAALIAAP